MASSDTPVSRRLQNVKHIIIVLSGKGGVGKSSVSTQLALSLYASSLPSPRAPRVGILDVDLTGPSIPRMIGLDKHGVHQSSDGWVPVYADGSEARLACMSVGFLLKRREDSVVWRGPKKNAMIRQFLSDVRWGELDYLIVDTPPGTCSLSCCMECMANNGTQARPMSISLSWSTWRPCKPNLDSLLCSSQPRKSSP
jgi:Mrp family chromosome partitioning ATPase